MSLLHRKWGLFYVMRFVVQVKTWKCDKLWSLFTKICLFFRRQNDLHLCTLTCMFVRNTAEVFLSFCLILSLFTKFLLYYFWGKLGPKQSLSSTFCLSSGWKPSSYRMMFHSLILPFKLHVGLFCFSAVFPSDSEAAGSIIKHIETSNSNEILHIFKQKKGTKLAKHMFYSRHSCFSFCSKYVEQWVRLQSSNL